MKKTLFILVFVAALLALHFLYEDSSYNSQLAVAKTSDDNSYNSQLVMAKADGGKEIASTQMQKTNEDITTIKNELVNLIATVDQSVAEQKRDRSQSKSDIENIMDRLSVIEERLDRIEGQNLQNPQTPQVIHIRQNYFKPEERSHKRRKPQ